MVLRVKKAKAKAIAKADKLTINYKLYTLN